MFNHSQGNFADDEREHLPAIYTDSDEGDEDETGAVEIRRRRPTFSDPNEES